MTPLWRWLAFPAMAMSLGWGLRGYIGGGPLGAMIPGAMVGLALCLLLGREGDSALVAAFAAVGVGFGGEMTYGQTVGLSLQPETYWWAITGFAVKGAAWGLLGGAMIGAALDRSRYRMPDLAGGLVLLVAGTWAGWRVINEPKLIYFSNRVDRPRPEVWAGLLVGALVLLLWLAWRAGARLAAGFAGWGAIGGGLGFASGAALQVWGTRIFGVFPLGWWKVMELTFGALLGLALGWCAWRHRGELTRDGEGAATGVADGRRGRNGCRHNRCDAADRFPAAGALRLRSGGRAPALPRAAVAHALLADRDLAHLLRICPGPDEKQASLAFRGHVGMGCGKHARHREGDCRDATGEADVSVDHVGRGSDIAAQGVRAAGLERTGHDGIALRGDGRAGYVVGAADLQRKTFSRMFRNSTRIGVPACN